MLVDVVEEIKRSNDSALCKPIFNVSGKKVHVCHDVMKVYVSFGLN